MPTNRYLQLGLGWALFFGWFVVSAVVAKIAVGRAIGYLERALRPAPAQILIIALKPLVAFVGIAMVFLVTYLLLEWLVSPLSAGTRLRDWFIRINLETLWKQ